MKRIFLNLYAYTFLIISAIAIISLSWGQGIIIKGQSSGIGVKTKGNVLFSPNNSGAVLTSITVIPANTSQVVGLTVTYLAQGNYSSGPPANLTSQATWSSTPTITSNTSNVVKCLTSGNATVQATVGLITGTGNLTCNSIQVTPQGTLPNAIINVAYPPIQFGATGGVAPYTFGSSGLPGWLSLTGLGLLSGTPNTLGTYNFSVTATDSLSNTSPPDNLTVQVVNATGENNDNCQSNGVTNYSPSTDSFATLPTACFYTAIANTPAGGPVIDVCPVGQTSGGFGITCTYHTLSAALTFISTQQDPCGTEIQIYATLDDTPTGTQNRYQESITSMPPVSCGPPAGKPWIWIRNKQFSLLPPAGTRISPAWAGLNSQSVVINGVERGRPPYGQPATPGKYLPELVCSFTPFCTVLATDSSSVGISGFRIMGLWITAPFGHNSCGSPGGCAGSSSDLISFGCDNQAQSSCGAHGATYMLVDRVLLTGCEDLTTINCVQSMANGIRLQGGNYLGIINSYVVDFKCNQGIGPCVESHGVLGGNVSTTTDDGPIEISGNFIEASSVGVFMGGGPSTSGIFPKNIRIRKNHIWKPLLWKTNDPAWNTVYGGYAANAFISKNGNNYTNPTCTLAAPDMTGPPTPVQATCHFTISAGKITDIIIDNPGKGYSQNIKVTITDTTGSGAIAFVGTGFNNVKNQLELKQCVLCEIVGNVLENVWVGQSDQNGHCILVTPKNGNNLCPTCKVEDTTFRYNFCRGMVRAMDAAGANADTRCPDGQLCIPGPVQRVSIHDNVFDNINGDVWINKPGAYSQESGGGFLISNVNPPVTAVNSIDINHNTIVPTLPNTRSATGNSFLSLNSNCLNGIAVLDKIRFRNNIGAGGVKNTTTRSHGCFGAANAGSNSILALSSILTSSNLLPVGGGFYTTGQLMATFWLPELGAGYTSAPACAISGGGGTGASCTAYKFGDAIPGGGTCAVGSSGKVGCYSWVAGTGFTSAPTVTLTGGGFTTAAFALATIKNGIITSIDPETGGHGYTSKPTCTVVGTNSILATCDTTISGGNLTSLFVTANGGGYTANPTITLTGGGGSGALTTSNIAGIGNLQGGSWCFNSNGQVDNPFNGNIPMTPYPTAQGDPTNNTCPLHTPGTSNLTVSTWSDVKFKGFIFNPNGDGSEGPTGDLHLCTAAGGSCSGASPFHNAADDGLDMGADIDKVLGTSTGTPSVFTGCFLNTSTGIVQCP